MYGDVEMSRSGGSGRAASARVFMSISGGAPDAAEAIERARLLIGDGEIDKAISLLSRSLREAPDSFDLRIALCEAYLCKRDSGHEVVENLARNEFEKALGLVPPDSGSHAKLVRIGIRLGAAEELADLYSGKWADLPFSADQKEALSSGPAPGAREGKADAGKVLRAELPKLVKMGLISAEASENLERYYGMGKKARSENRGRIIFAFLGGALLGLGVILIFAHNWHNLSRPVRAVVALTPLFCAGTLCYWVLLKRAGSTAWREGSSIFLVLALGAGIALVSQTYHLESNWGAFILSWMLPIAPAVYLMDATGPALVYIAGITSWGVFQRFTDGNQAWFWVMAAVMLPRYMRLTGGVRLGWGAVVMGWEAAICGAIAITFSARGDLVYWLSALLLCYFSTLYYVGLEIEKKPENILRRPLTLTGLAGTCWVALALTYDGAWKAVWSYSEMNRFKGLVDYPLGYAIFAVLAAGVAMGLARSVRRRRVYDIMLGSFAVMAVVLGPFAHSLKLYRILPRIAPILLFNAMLFSLGVMATVDGIRTGRAGLANGGVLIIAAVILARFFDAKFSILARGLVFLVLGLGFLAANIAIWQRKSES